MPSTPLPRLHTSVETVLNAQDELGWYLPFTGFWLSSWCSLQQEYYDSIGSGKTGVRWLSQVIILLWDVAYSLWDHRNTVLHSKENQCHQLAVVAEIRKIYRLPRNHFPPKMRRRFIPIGQLLRQSVPYQEAWLAAFDTYYTAATRQMDPRTRQRRLLLRSLRQSS